MLASPRLEARQLRCTVGASASVPPINFRVARGDGLRVDGPSGAGKSTLLRALCRLTAAEGSLLLDGQPAEEIPPGHWRRRVAYLAQTPVMLPGTVRDNLAAPFATKRASDRFDEVAGRTLLDQLGLDSELLCRQAATLSGGEASRVALCRALLLDPIVLLADEPTAALDDHHAAAVVKLLRCWIAEGGALLLVAHDAARWAALASERLLIGSSAGAAS